MSTLSRADIAAGRRRNVGTVSRNVVVAVPTETKKSSNFSLMKSMYFVLSVISIGFAGAAIGLFPKESPVLPFTTGIYFTAGIAAVGGLQNLLIPSNVIRLCIADVEVDSLHCVLMRAIGFLLICMSAFSFYFLTWTDTTMVDLLNSTSTNQTEITDANNELIFRSSQILLIVLCVNFVLTFVSLNLKTTPAILNCLILLANAVVSFLGTFDF